MCQPNIVTVNHPKKKIRMKTPIAGWYVIYTRPRHERKVVAYLSELKIVSLLPVTRVFRKTKSKIKYLDTPLFPCYIFICVKDLDEFYRVLSLDGVLYYVRTGKEVAKVSESVIHNIRVLAGQGIDSDIEVSDADFLPGKKILIKDGAMTGLNGEIIETRGQQKILVRIRLLQRSILITLSSDVIASIAS
jgi:transcriptional antiterminator RfaH